MTDERVTVHLSSTRPYLKGRQLLFPLGLATSLFVLWGFSYGLLDVLNKHFQNVLKITKFESTILQIVYFGGGYFCFSPIAGEILRRRGYKFTIVFGLVLFGLGAISYWPAIRFSDIKNGNKAFYGFVICTWIIACGIAALETSANSYVTLIGNPKSAAVRLQFCQSWNGIASFLGPFIASKLFFSTEKTTSLTNVQYVYISVASVAFVVAILFMLSKLPESVNQINTTTINEDQNTKSFWKQYNMLLAFVAIFCYVGAQVSNDSFFLNYVTEDSNYDDSTAARLLSYSLIIFTSGRFVGTLLARYFYSDFILVIYGLCASCLTCYITLFRHGYSVYFLMGMYFFESLMFPTLFVLGTEKLDRHAHRAAGFLIMGISGGAIFPPIQGAIADRYSTQLSFVVPTVGLFLVFVYGLIHWTKNDFNILRGSQTKSTKRSMKSSKTSEQQTMTHDSSPFLN